MINACGTGKPGASEFIRNFNGMGVNAFIVTSTAVDPEMAGDFMRHLSDLVEYHADEANYTLGQAKFDAVHRLMDQYGHKALAYSLIGNGGVRVCAPRKKN